MMLVTRLLASPSARPGTRPCNRARCKTCNFISPSVVITTRWGVFIIHDSFTSRSRNLNYTNNLQKVQPDLHWGNRPNSVFVLNTCKMWTTYHLNLFPFILTHLTIIAPETRRSGCTFMSSLWQVYLCMWTVTHFYQGTLALHGMNTQHTFFL